MHETVLIEIRKFCLSEVYNNSERARPVDDVVSDAAKLEAYIVRSKDKAGD